MFFSAFSFILNRAAKLKLPLKVKMHRYYFKSRLKIGFRSIFELNLFKSRIELKLITYRKATRNLALRLILQESRAITKSANNKAAIFLIKCAFFHLVKSKEQYGIAIPKKVYF